MNFAVAIQFLPLAMGGLSFASSLFGAAGRRQKAAARNRARKQNWKHKLAVRKTKWYQALSVYGAKVNQFYKGVDESTLAANRGYSSAQIALKRKFNKVKGENLVGLTKFLGSRKNFEKTGKSIARINALDYGAMMKGANDRYMQLTLDKEDYKTHVENIHRKAGAHQDRLYSDVWAQPIASLAPPAPELEAETLGAMDYFNAGVSGFESWLGARTT